MLPIESDFETKFTFETEATSIADDSPFKILLLGDWSGSRVKTDLLQRQPIEIDRDNFDDVMKLLKVNVELDLFDNESDITTLSFGEMEDFHPDKIYKCVSHFAALNNLRQRLLDKNTFEKAAQDARLFFNQTVIKSSQEFASESVSNISSETDSKNLLDRILSQSPETTASPASRQSQSNEIRDLLRESLEPFLIKIDENEQSKLLNAIDTSIGELMRKILHYPYFQNLESAWRALSFTVRQIDTSADLKVYILDVTKDELSSNLKHVSNLADTFLYRILFSEAENNTESSPWSLIGGNFSFDCNLEDIAALIRIAKLFASAEVPFISSMRPETLNISSFEDSDENIILADSEARKLWTTLRSLPESQYLGLTIPCYLARLPYGLDTDPIDSFTFEEFESYPKHDDYLWSNPCFICVILMAQTFEKYGWNPGETYVQDLEGLPFHIFQVDGETKTKPCLETPMNLKVCQNALGLGLMPLFSPGNADRVRLARFQSIAFPHKPLRGKWN
jgi:type VI secretion system protein ImpC